MHIIQFRYMFATSSDDSSIYRDLQWLQAMLRYYIDISGSFVKSVSEGKDKYAENMSCKHPYARKSVL